uniref:Uncharacterized protein n=1 Tax=Aplanochytrium stocchinoi TaxID=215587 RepID=A0A7S3LKK5_9STRA
MKAEINEVVKRIPEDFTVQNLRSLRTVNSLFHEVARYYTAFPTQTLEVRYDEGFTFKSCNVTVPKGWHIILSRIDGAVRKPGNDYDSLENPFEKFQPDRYLHGDYNEEEIYWYLFSEKGVRECPGKMLAKLEFAAFMVIFTKMCGTFSIDKPIDSIPWKSGRLPPEEYRLTIQ